MSHINGVMVIATRKDDRAAIVNDRQPFVFVVA